MIDAVKAAFVQGRLTRDEFDARIGQTLASRTYADLGAVAAGTPAAAPTAQPPRGAARRRVSNAARWGTCGFITPAILAVGFAIGSLSGDGGFGGMAAVIALVYFFFWLSAGAEMLWQWFCMSLPTARMCVRCAHTAASHRAPASCTVRHGLKRCSCAGYVPPGLSPKTADQRLISARCP